MPAERQVTARCVAVAAARLWSEVLALADRQHGVVALAQLVAMGVQARTVRAWVARARLQRIHREVFAVGHKALRREGHWMAATLACGPGALLSHSSAAALESLRSSDATLIDVTVPGRIGRSRRGIRVHSGDRVDRDEITEISGIPCTSVPRTILDLAAVLDRRALERLCEQAWRIEQFDFFTIGSLIARHRGRRGVAHLREVLAEWDPDLARTRSELEVRMLRLIARAGIDRPIVNGVIDAGGRSFEVDFHWPRRQLIVETDGRAFHDNPLARNRDAERDRVLTAAGWRLDRYDWDDVAVTPNRTARAIAAALEPSGS